MTDAIPAIRITSLTKLYGKTTAVDNLCLDVAAGEFFGFLGPNGAGKTTTIRVLSGMVHADGGSATVDGSPSDRGTTVKRVIGVMPESRGYDEWMTALEYVTFFARLYGINPATETAKAKLALVGLSTRGNSRIGALSRGMKQRLGLARAIVNDPKVLFLDEPTLGLDPQGQEDIRTLLKTMNRQGTTVFYSSHLLNEVAELCSRMAIINNGRLVAEGTLQQLRDRANLPGSDLTSTFLKLTSS
jgi:ABC-2 type transport system ATP-binding protein